MRTLLLLSPDSTDGTVPVGDPSTAPTPNVGQQIGDTIVSVGKVVGPIVTSLDPPIGKAVTLAFAVLAVVEPAAYNAIANLLSGKDLTPAELQEIKDVETALADPDSYLA